MTDPVTPRQKCPPLAHPRSRSRPQARNDQSTSLYPSNLRRARLEPTNDYQSIITIEPGKRGGRPCIRRMRISVADVLGWLAAGMTHQAIITDYPELTEQDILACLAYAADRERRLLTAASSCCSTRTSASNSARPWPTSFQAPARSACLISRKPRIPSSGNTPKTAPLRW